MASAIHCRNCVHRLTTRHHSRKMYLILCACQALFSQAGNNPSEVQSFTTALKQLLHMSLQNFGSAPRTRTASVHIAELKTQGLSP